MKTRKKALYLPTKNLTTNYIFENGEHENASLVLSSKNIHAQLFAASKDFKKKRAELTSANGTPVYSGDISRVNFSTAAVTILYADTTPEEGYVGEDILSATFAVAAYGTDRLVTCGSLYDVDSSYIQTTVTAVNKALRNYDFNYRLEQRVKAFSLVAPQFQYYNAVASVPALRNLIANANFHEAIHHTEQGEMEVLSSPIGIAGLKNRVLALDGKYVFGLVLDVFTDRPMCCNCNACLIGMQCTQKRGFLADFQATLGKNGVFTRENGNLMLSVRVSTSYGGEPFNIAPSNVHDYDPDRKCVIYQANNTQFNVNCIIRKNSYSLATYPGSIFTSKYISAGKLSSEIERDEEKILPALQF